MEQSQSKCLQRDRLIRLKPTDPEELAALQKTVVMQGAEALGAINGKRYDTARIRNSNHF